MNSVVVWKDKLLIKWDGSLPPGASERAIHSPEDIIPFWAHLRGHITFSKRSGAYVMALSKQNTQRIVAQFGKIPVKNRGAIDELKKKQSNLVDMIHTAQKVKDLPMERLPEYEYKVKPLGDYQHRGVVFLRNVKKAPFFADCGMGKTYCVLTSTETQIKNGEIPPGRTLICGKLATLEGGWIEDAETFTGLKLTNLWIPNHLVRRKQRIIERLNTPADAYVINHEGLRLFEKELVEKNFLKVVVDESTVLKGFKSMDPRSKGGVFGKALMRVAHSAEWRVVMSGTPAPNGPMDLWGQFYFLDPEGLLLEPSHKDFMNRFYQTVDLRKGADRRKPMGPRTPRKIVPKKTAIGEINDIIDPIMFRVRLRDHIKDLPELTPLTRDIEMSKTQLAHYKDMEKNLRVVIDDTRITVPVKIAQMMKLRQITGGFIIDHQEEVHPLKTNPKIKELDSLLNDEISQEDKVVIYAQYQWEIELIERRYKNIVSAYGGNSSNKNLKNIHSFRKNPKTRLIVLHPKSCAHGINFTMARYMIFYSLDHSSEDNYQCIRRIERPGQKNAMFVYYLVCIDTVDKMAYQAIGLKNMNQLKLLDQTRQDEIDKKLLNLWRTNAT